ncbi:MAG: SDR family oxidoreductase [Chloroflexi bacterium]|nr:SDR family oxidoreductase [Chloroflexota bacterium]
MKVVVFGATGGTGIHVVRQALAAGHAVTAVARRPAAVDIQHECLKVIQGDVMEPDTIAEAMRGQDVVVSALGTTSTRPMTLYSEGTGNIMAVMQVAGVRRLLCVSAGGVEVPSGRPLLQRLIIRYILQRILRHLYADMLRMEAAVQSSNLNWTIIRPPRLTDGSCTGRYQIVVNQPLLKGWQISRADLAHCIVTHLDDPAFQRSIVELAY